MNLHVNKIMMKTMTKIMQIVSSGPKVKKAHLLWPSNLIGRSQTIQVTQVLTTMNLTKMCTLWTSKLHTKI
jgi:hypothetical protein